MEAFKMALANSDAFLGKWINDHLIGLRAINAQLYALRAAFWNKLKPVRKDKEVMQI
jgi:hypothetical protein